MRTDAEMLFLRELLAVVDSEVKRLRKVASGESPENREADEAIGLGFAACQQFLRTTCRQLPIELVAGLATGPKRCGMHVAQIVDHAANAWRYQEEPGALREETIAGLRKLGLEDRPYRLSNLVAIVASPACLGSLIPLLAEWRKGLRDGPENVQRNPTTGVLSSGLLRGRVRS